MEDRSFRTLRQEKGEAVPLLTFYEFIKDMFHIAETNLNP